MSRRPNAMERPAGLDALMRTPRLGPPEHVKNPAKWAHERLVGYIQSFEAALDDEHEIGARLVSFGATVVFHIEDIGYHGPDIITFRGIDTDGRRVQLVQHVTQLSVLLIAMEKIGPEARRIGFALSEEGE